MSINTPVLQPRWIVLPFVSIVVQKLHFHRIGHPVLDIARVDDDTGIRGGVELVFEIERKIRVIPLEPQRTVFRRSQNPI